MPGWRVVRFPLTDFTTRHPGIYWSAVVPEEREDTMSVASYKKKTAKCKDQSCIHYWRTMSYDQVRKVESRERCLDTWKQDRKERRR